MRAAGPAQSQPDRPVVVSRRWDSLGARLSGIASAAGLAIELGCDFAFEWPDRAYAVDFVATALFSDRFCDRHLVEPAEDTDLEIRLVAAHGMSIADVRTLMERERPDLLRFDEPYALPSFTDDTAEQALERFRAGTALIEFSDRAQAIRTTVEAAVEGIEIAVHARYGDLVTGDWRRFVAREKFRPRAYLERAIEKVVPSADTVLVVSDSAEFVADLASRRDVVVSLDGLMPGYGALGETERAWADLFALQAIGRIIAPSSSAFSGFGAGASGRRPIDVLDQVPSGERIEVLHSFLERREPHGPFERNITARETCHLIDSDTGELEPDDRYRLARRAFELDPGHPEAATRAALTAVEQGRFEAATRAIEAALIAADAGRAVHQDPRMDVLVAALVKGVVGRACRIGEEGPALAEIVEEIGRLSPYQQPRRDLRRAARYLFGISGVLGAPTRRTARRARRRLADLGPRAGWTRPDVWADLEYSPLLATIERAGFWLSEVASITVAGEETADWSLVAPSRNGVPWVECTIDSGSSAAGILVSVGPARVVAPRVTDDPRTAAVFAFPLRAGMVVGFDAAGTTRSLAVQVIPGVGAAEEQS